MASIGIYDLWLEELQDLYDGEHTVVEILPKLVATSKSPWLKDHLGKHLQQTRDQILRLRKIAAEMGVKFEGKVSRGAKVIAEETTTLSEKDLQPLAKEAVIVAGMQKLSYYKIAGYDMATKYAEMMEHDEDAMRLNKSLGEEVEWVNDLSKMTSRINVG